MELKDVLLTDKDMKVEYYDPDNPNVYDPILVVVRACNKLQCLKLLKVMEEPCSHAKPPFFLAHPSRLADCPECMAELKKDLGGE